MTFINKMFVLQLFNITILLCNISENTSNKINKIQYMLIIFLQQIYKIQYNLITKYISEYVSCPLCKSCNTILEKDNRLYMMICGACKSTRSVTNIKSGFHVMKKGERRKERQITK